MRSLIVVPVVGSCSPILAVIGLALTSAVPASAQQLAGWAGSIRCELQAQAQGYSHQETQTWTLTGAPAVQGSVTAYPATWTVVGTGQHDRTTGTSTRRIAQWTANVAGVTAPIGFTLHALGRTFDVSKWHAQLTRGGGYTGTDQFINGGVPTSSQPLVATVYEWQFPKIEAATTDTQLAGSNTTQVRTQVGPLQPGEAVATVTCAWSLARGSAPLLPPPTLQAPPAAPTQPGGSASGGTAPAGTAPGGSATTNPPSPAGVPVAPPAPVTTAPPSASPPGSTVPVTPPPPLSGATVVPIVPVLTSTLPAITLTPSSAPAGATNVLVTVTGFNTDFTADYGRTYATFQGKSWTYHPRFTVISPTTGTMLIEYPLTESPTDVYIQTGSTVIRVNGGFTVTPAGSTTAGGAAGTGSPAGSIPAGTAPAPPVTSEPVYFSISQAGRADLQFGQVEVGSTSPQLSVILVNTEGSPLGPINMSGGGPSGAFGASQNCQGRTLTAGGLCTVIYTFTPTAAGPATGASDFAVSYTPSLPDGEKFSVTLSGTGVVAGGTTSPLATATVVPVIPALTANFSDLWTVANGVMGPWIKGQSAQLGGRMRNLGPSPVTGAILTVTMPPSGFSITQMQCSGLQDGPPIPCPTIAQLANGFATPTIAPRQFRVDITGTVTGDVGSSLTFAMTGRAPSGAFDPDSTNNGESATVVIGP